MTITRTLAQLRSEVLIMAGMNTSGTSVDLTPTVLNAIINNAVWEGWDVITGKWLDYHTAMFTFDTTIDEDTYPLPTDFYKLRAVWISEGGRYIKLRPADLDRAHVYTGQQAGTKRGYRYRVTNRNLVLMPVPQAVESLRVFYVPNKQEMTADGDTLTLDVPIELKYILSIAWRDVLDRQNLDPSPAVAKIQAYEQKLRVAADSLDAAEPFYLGVPPFEHPDEEPW